MPGHELALRLLLGFRLLVDELHLELARQGHPGVRPLHGFVLRAIGSDGVTAAELGRRLGVSKQAAGKTVDGLERLGYVERSRDPADARRSTIQLTARAEDCLGRSAVILGQLREQWAERIGPTHLARLEADLRLLTPTDAFRLDAPGWFSAAS